MDALWSREFVIALISFLAPTAFGAGLVYRRMLKSVMRRRTVHRKISDACARYVLDHPGTQAEAAPGEAATRSLKPIQQPLENLKQRLVEFRTSIQQSRHALGQLQECDCRFSVDLGHAGDVMQQAFLK